MKQIPFLGKEDIYLFNRGELFQSYLKFGAHKVEMNKIWGVHFAVWAPNATMVRIIGDFNNWYGEEHQMNCQGKTGVWTLFVPHLDDGAMYKYEILTAKNEVLHKSDPFAFYSELRPKTASIVCSLDGYDWKDELWYKNNKDNTFRESPILIYEVHLGSWKRKEDNTFLNYREIAEDLVDYVKRMGFTHIELLPITEHPLDGSWGYQVTGYYAATSRYGFPQDLMYLIEKCHQSGIGVIMDWVPGHFCRDIHGLSKFDGTALYEIGEHQEWGTYKFDFKRSEVRSFLISNALFWFDIFHIDGLRVDGVTSMLYRNYGMKVESKKKAGLGKQEDQEAILFLQKLNEVVFAQYPQALMIAEESTDWPMVTRPSYDGGLGFNFKWNMGWMNDTLRYMQSDFVFRKKLHNMLTFSLMYAFSEDFILPFSHDEVVHGKKSLINKMPGDYWQKFAGLRTMYCMQICHPGKKLLFMGGEFAQFIEWREYEELEWFLLEYEMHKQYQEYVRNLNHFYLSEKSLWQNDHDWNGFTWIDVNNNKQSILVFQRGASKDEFLIVVINLKPEVHNHFRIGIPVPGRYQEVLNTDAACFGGSGKVNKNLLKTEEIPWHGQPYSLLISVPPLGGMILKLYRSGKGLKSTKY